MFSITGKIGSKSVTVTWDKGVFDVPFIQKAVVNDAQAFKDSGEYMTSAQQPCTPSISDPLFAYERARILFNEIEETQGDIGLIEMNEEGTKA